MRAARVRGGASDEGLDAQQPSGREVGHRLVVQRQLVVGQSVADLAGQLEAVAAVVIALGGVHGVAQAPALGLVHRDVGVAQQGARVLRVPGKVAMPMLAPTCSEIPASA